MTWAWKPAAERHPIDLKPLPSYAEACWSEDVPEILARLATTWLCISAALPPSELLRVVESFIEPDANGVREIVPEEQLSNLLGVVDMVNKGMTLDAIIHIITSLRADPNESVLMAGTDPNGELHMMGGHVISDASDPTEN